MASLFSELVYRVAAAGAALAFTGLALDVLRSSSRRRAHTSNLPLPTADPAQGPALNDSPLLHTRTTGITYWPNGHFEQNLPRAKVHGGGAGSGFAAPVSNIHDDEAAAPAAVPESIPAVRENTGLTDDTTAGMDLVDELNRLGYW